ncbi:Type II secretion system F domain protein [Sphingobium chlorophenolicum L-1]|uniref:Type II secretion system F domain protein n=1 Tax=Sphingobium chlorophenolicum L-1 TaxID=690566 RepID=F6F310_SPHCR|nr:type II secretion system F family protein [Sphingobium chlorophenolicum]AEG50822.1 Type II secretion system F domain protein [Sphingobium chlorophenolicum L-1]
MGALFLLCAALGAACAAAGVRMWLADRRLEARLGMAGDAPALRVPGVLAARGRDGSEIAGKLMLAGFQDRRAADWFVWARMGATGGVALAAMLVSRVVWGGFFVQPLLIVIVAGLTYVGAKQAIHLLAARRARAIMAEFPFLLDLMLMMLESGVSLDQCFRSIARDEAIAVPHHARLIAMLVADLERGMRYDLALDRWAARVAVSGARELAALFRQALFQGVELAPALREFVREFTQRRVMRAREAMGGITVRMVVLMILFFMPALFVVLGGPPVVAIFDTLRGISR